MRDNPPAGDARSCNIAIIQHRLIIARRHSTSGNGPALARRRRISRKTASRTLLGERWMGNVLAAALLTASSPTAPHRA